MPNGFQATDGHGFPDPNWRPPHQHHAQPYVPGPPKPVEIKSLTVPILMVGAFALFLISATYMAAVEMAAIKYSIREVSRQLDNNTAGTNSKIGRIERELVSRTSSRWTRRDQDQFVEKFASKQRRLTKAGDVRQQPVRFQRAKGLHRISGQPTAPQS